MIFLILQAILAFTLIISFIVFIHEFGHFYVARLCKVKVEVFAIGFGKEIFGFFDKKGTRWKFCMIPMGGYVKMYGDKNASSNTDFEAIKNFSEEEKKQSFIFKNVWQKIAIVAAGPIANFVLAIAVFTILLRINGFNQALPIVDEVIENSAAFESGIKNGDEILSINNQEIKFFSDMQEIVMKNADKKLTFKIARNNKIIEIEIAPKLQEKSNIFGEKMQTGILGVTSKEIIHQDYNIFQAFCQANLEVLRISKAVLVAIYELITGQRSVKELSGPIKIANYSAKTIEIGFEFTLFFIAMISINLGIMNLLPLPMLDGGHLLFYFFEAIFKKPIPQKIQEYAFQFGFFIILLLMIFTTFNDISNLMN